VLVVIELSYGGEISLRNLYLVKEIRVSAAQIESHEKTSIIT
jgi:hypothetical protein